MSARSNLSEWAIRVAAEARGWPTSHEQFRSYVDWGLIQPDSAGDWPENAADLLVAIREAERVARPLPRRVLWLRSNYLAFPIPSFQVRRALLAMCGPKSIEAPNRKLRRINKALDESYRSFASEARNANGVTTSSEYRGWPRDWTEPATDSWRWLIQEAEEPNFETRVGFAYHTDYMFRGRPAWPADDEIALEERVFLLLVRDLHIDHCRALQGLLHAIRYWRSNTEPFKPPVVAVALANERRGSDAYVVLCDEAKKLPSAELRQLNETLRSTVRPIWAPGRINFVDALPSTPWSMS